MAQDSAFKSPAEQLLASGRQALEAGDRLAAARLLVAARSDPQVRLAAHNLIERNRLSGWFGELTGVNCQISPSDDIFRFFESHPTSINPLRDYLADGWRTLSELMLLLEEVGRPLLHAGQVLEFASGHGRFTRHLVKALGPARVVVSDVVADAVDFSKEAFGVRGFVSHRAPERLAWPERFDLVFVLSLFSHLPRHTWGRWLNTLYQGTAPGGLLVFSTHGHEAAERQQVSLDDSGFFFAPSSESSAVDPQDYGTAFTSEQFVRAQVEEWLGEVPLLRLFPVQFWNHQDAWVVRRT